MQTAFRANVLLSDATSEMCKIMNPEQTCVLVHCRTNWTATAGCVSGLSQGSDVTPNSTGSDVWPGGGAAAWCRIQSAATREASSPSDEEEGEEEEDGHGARPPVRVDGSHDPRDAKVLEGDGSAFFLFFFFFFNFPPKLIWQCPACPAERKSWHCGALLHCGISTASNPEHWRL